MDQLKIINFIKHWPLVTCVISILSDEIWIRNKVLLCTNVWQLSQGKALVWLLGLWAQLRLFSLFIEHFYLKEQLTDKLWLFGRHFLKNGWSQSISTRRAIDSICCQWWNLSFQVKFRILENYYLSPWMWQFPNT